MIFLFTDGFLMTMFHVLKLHQSETNSQVWYARQDEEVKITRLCMVYLKTLSAAITIQ
jgi:hypothetical protein